MAYSTKHDPQQLYKKIKGGNSIYKEELHCPMILEVMSSSSGGTVSAFCVKALISDTTFYRWISKYPIFSECYRIGNMISRQQWEDEGRLGKDEEFFNMEYWKTIGSSRYGVGKSNRVRLEVSEESNPYDQYKQIIRQASAGDFTAGELKQIMESLNVGTRTYEYFKLQEEVDLMKEDMKAMELNRGNNSKPIEKNAEVN